MLNNYEIKQIKNSLRKKLSRLEIYESDDQVGVVSREDKLYIHYKKGKYIGMLGTTHFAIQVEGDTAYLLSIGREERFKGKGLGKSLYLIVEELCKERCINKIQLTFSGQDKDYYWESLGFNKIKGFNQMEKILR